MSIFRKKKTETETELTMVDEYGSKFSFLNGDLHREDGPSIETANGTKLWYINGKLHREDGPAIEEADGDNEYWLNGVRDKDQEIIAILKEISAKLDK